MVFLGSTIFVLLSVSVKWTSEREDMEVPDWLNEPGEFAAIFGIFSIVMSALLWIIRKEIITTKHEFKPNHGNSLRDVVNRIEKNQDEIKSDIREIRSSVNEQHERLFNSVGKVHGRIDEHIAEDHLRRQT